MSEQKYIRVDDVVDFLRESAEGLHNTPAWATLLDECAGKIEQFPTYTPADILAGMWVPVTPETMPKEAGRYQVYLKTGDQGTAYFDGAHFIGWYKVTHWAPLLPTPRTPKEEKKI